MENEMGLPVVTHLLQYTLRSICLGSQWDYAVFWRIIPRNYPPPKWDAEGGASDRSRANRRNWILVWEDGFCDFSDCPRLEENTRSSTSGAARNTVNINPENDHCVNHGLQPELFFKMSHEVYNYGEGVVGKVAADNSHKWIYRDPMEHVLNFLSPWQNSIDPHPRAWEAQFNSGIQTIALIAVREGLVQLGSIKKVMEDLNFVILLQRKFNYLQSIPGVLLPHPSSVGVSTTGTPFQQSLNSVWNHGRLAATAASRSLERCFSWNGSSTPEGDIRSQSLNFTRPTGHGYNDRISWGSSQYLNGNQEQKLFPRSQCLVNYSPNIIVMPSMSSLQALLSKLPSVTPQTSSLAGRHGSGIALMGNSSNANSSQSALESAGNQPFPNKVPDLEQRREDMDGTAIDYSYTE